MGKRSQKVINPLTVRDKSTAEIAELNEVTEQTVLNWIEGGAPHTPGKRGNGLGHRLSEFEVAKWRIEVGALGKNGVKHGTITETEEELTLRKLKAQCEKAERENAVSAGRLIDRDEEQDRDIKKIVTLKNRLSGLGAIISPQMQGLDGAERQTVIDDAINEILNEFSR